MSITRCLLESIFILDLSPQFFTAYHFCFVTSLMSASTSISIIWIFTLNVAVYINSNFTYFSLSTDDGSWMSHFIFHFMVHFIFHFILYIYGGHYGGQLLSLPDLQEALR